MLTQQPFDTCIFAMPILAPNWIFSQFTTWIFVGVRILLVGQCTWWHRLDLSFAHISEYN